MSRGWFVTTHYFDFYLIQYVKTESTNIRDHCVVILKQTKAVAQRINNGDLLSYGLAIFTITEVIAM